MRLRDFARVVTAAALAYVAFRLNAASRWLLAPFDEPRHLAAMEAGRGAFIEAAANKHGEAQAREQLAARAYALALATGMTADRGGTTEGIAIRKGRTND